MVHVPDPAVGYLEFPTSDESRARKRRVKCGVSLSEPTATVVDQTVVLGDPLCEETQPLEDCAVSEPVSIGQELPVVAVVVAKVDGKTVGNMLDTATQLGVVEDVDNSPGKIGNLRAREATRSIEYCL